MRKEKMHPCPCQCPCHNLAPNFHDSREDCCSNTSDIWNSVHGCWESESEKEEERILSTKGLEIMTQAPVADQVLFEEVIKILK